MTKPPPSTADAPKRRSGREQGAGIGIPASADEPRVLMLTPDQAAAEIKRLLRQTGMTRDELEAAAADWRLDADQRGALQDIRGIEWLLARAGIPANAWRDTPANTDQKSNRKQKEKEMMDEITTPDGVDHQPRIAADTLGLPTPTAICRGCRAEWPCDAAIDHWLDANFEPPWPDWRTRPIDANWLARLATWNVATFGPASRTDAVLDHAIREIEEIRRAPDDPLEWADAIILLLVGAMRAGVGPQQVINAIRNKHTINQGRAWPDWRTAGPGPIEHIRGEQQA